MTRTLEARLTWTSNERAALGENPLWDGPSRSLFWIDVIAPSVSRLQDGQVRVYPLPRPVASIFLAGPGRLLVATRSAFAVLDLADGRLAPIEGLVPPSPEERFNDGRCDAEGRLWISTMDRKLRDDIGSLVGIVPGANGPSVSMIPTGARLGNGVCFSPDGRWLYFSDTHRREIFRHPLAAGETIPGARESLVRLDDAEGRPDGCSVDAEGCLWSARVGGGRIDRYRPDGRPIGSLRLPVTHPTHCCFGGEALDTLFVTSSRHPQDAPAFADQPLAGAVLAYDVGVRGLPEAQVALDGMA